MTTMLAILAMLEMQDMQVEVRMTGGMGILGMILGGAHFRFGDSSPSAADHFSGQKDSIIKRSPPLGLARQPPHRHAQR